MAIRQPVRKSAIEKKNQIIKKGFELIVDKGYHNVTCIDIAKYANVSTGIIYQYFIDKRDIFISGIKDYANTILYPDPTMIPDTISSVEVLEEVFKALLDSFIELHVYKKQAHERLMEVSNLDEEVADLFNQCEIAMTKKMSELLIKHGYYTDYMEEKIHMIYSLMDQLSHEIVYHKHSELNYEVMKKIVLKQIVSILS